MKYTAEGLSEVVARNTSIKGVLHDLGLQYAGGNHAHISRTIKKFGISTDHFLGKRSNLGRTFPKNQSEIGSVFVLRDKNDPPTKGETLRKHLIAAGRPYVCAVCEQSPEHNGKALVLPVDHINGQRWDNREINLRFLCPNCHSQTDTFSGKNSKRPSKCIPTAEDNGLDPFQ